jgi:hypothetical protein
MKMDEGVEKIETTLRRFFEYQRRRINFFFFFVNDGAKKRL